MKTGLEIDFDDREEIGAIQNIITDDSFFYVLANKRYGRLGYFLLMINVNNPEEECIYLIQWVNKLDIGNCDMYILNEACEQHVGSEEASHSIVVSYKCIGVNTFNIFVFDLESKLIKYWHESYQLWES